ncbi:MAG: glycoside hydrolase family 32 protein, partial [Tannerella sp.]|nr:glycoside hydrolase family 32 protein [Tannerella sp.]
MKLTYLLITSLLCANAAFAGDLQVRITKRYLNLPVSHKVERQVMTFEVGGRVERSFRIRLAAQGEADYWVFCDVSALKGKTLKISYPADDSALKRIYQDDFIAGRDSLYRETNRPQIHFTSRRGWNNDPNGLLFYEGEYHLFYQHNPYEREWENMHWGHAVSRDLIHWEELPVALFPDENGTMFSGSAVIDYENTAGFSKKDGTPAMVAIFTADSREKQVQCIAYSLDKGRTWTKYAGNPVIDSGAEWQSHDTRDP